MDRARGTQPTETIEQSDAREARLLNGRGPLQREGPYAQLDRMVSRPASDPRDSQGRLLGFGYEESDRDFSQAPAGVGTPLGGLSVGSPAVEGVCDRIAKRPRRASADEVEADFFNGAS